MSVFIRLATIVLAFCAAFAAHARPLEEIRKSGTIVLGVEGCCEPFAYTKFMKLIGYEVEMAEAVAQHMGLEVKWEIADFGKLLPGLAANQWDAVVASHAITPERSKSVTFAQPHYCSGGQIVSMSAEVSKAADLADRVVAVQSGTSYLDAVKKIPGIREIKELSNHNAARNALIARSADAWVADYFMVWKMNTQAELLGFHLGDVLFVEQIAAAFAKDNHALAAAWNKALAEVMQDGTIAALSHKYFKEDIRCK